MVEAVLRDRKPLGTFVGSLLLLLMIMSYQVTDRASGRTLLGNVLFQAFSPIQSGVMWVIDSVAGGVRSYFLLVNTNQENEVLRREVTELRIHIAANAHQAKENERLRKMLELKERLPYSMLAGEVVGRDARAVSGTLTVNRGSRSGVRMDLPVVTPVGAVGKTIQVAPLTTRVQLITDSGSAVGAMLNRTQIAGILSGSGGNTCVLRYLPLISDVKAGDVVVTSGQDGVFPQGLPVGYISRMLNESDLYKSAEVIPQQEFSSIHEVVFLLQPNTTTPLPAEK